MFQLDFQLLFTSNPTFSCTRSLSTMAPPSEIEMTNSSDPILQRTDNPSPTPSRSFFHKPILFKAAFKGDLKAAIQFFDNNSDFQIDSALSGSGKTALHIAAASGQTEFVKYLVNKTDKKKLEKTDNGGYTALYFAVAAGNLGAAKAMVEKNQELPMIPSKGDLGMYPILEAAMLGDRKLLLYLYQKTVDRRTSSDEGPYRGKNGAMLLHATIAANFYDIAESLVTKFPEVALSKENGQSAMDVVARKSTSFKSGTKLGLWERCIYFVIPVFLLRNHIDWAGCARADSKQAEYSTSSSPKPEHSNQEVVTSKTVASTESLNQTSGGDVENQRSTSSVNGMAQSASLKATTRKIICWPQRLGKDIVTLELILTMRYASISFLPYHDPTSSILGHLTFIMAKGIVKIIWCLIKSIAMIISWPIRSLVSFVKEVRSKKRMHHQADVFLNCICKIIEDKNDAQVVKDLVHSSFLDAAEYGRVELIVKCLEYFPQVMAIYDNNNYTILHKCIIHRQEKVFELLQNQWSAHQATLAAYHDMKGKNILHLAAKLAPVAKLKAVSGPALQMQSEMQWFKAVEKITKPTHRELKNKDADTPRAIFVEDHKTLVKNGEKWMRGLATSCSLVATLIAAMVFAVGFNVPGGYNDGEDKIDKIYKGIPVCIGSTAFLWFAISDAIALISALTSVLIFLSVLTSRYAEEDFLVNLPNRIILGLSTLFLSITATGIAFTSTYFIMFRNDFEWVPILVASLIGIPVFLFVLLQLPLFIEVVASTHGLGVLHRQRD